MTVKEVVVLYGTYQKYIMFEALTLHGFKKNGLEFFRKKISKSLSIFSPKKLKFLGGKTWAIRKPFHPANGPSKNI